VDNEEQARRQLGLNNLSSGTEKKVCDKVGRILFQFPANEKEKDPSNRGRCKKQKQKPAQELETTVDALDQYAKFKESAKSPPSVRMLRPDLGTLVMCTLASVHDPATRIVGTLRHRQPQEE